MELEDPLAQLLEVELKDILLYSPETSDDETIDDLDAEAVAELVVPCSSVASYAGAISCINLESCFGLLGNIWSAIDMLSILYVALRSSGLATTTC